MGGKKKKKLYVYKNKSDFPHGRFLQLPADFTGGSSKSFPCGVEPPGCRIRLAGDVESPWRVKEKVSRMILTFVCVCVCLGGIKEETMRDERGESHFLSLN